MEKPKALEMVTPSPDQIIETNLEKEFIEEAGNITKSIFYTMKVRMLEICASEGSTYQQREKTREYLAMWKDFSNSAFVRTQDMYKKSSENIETAINGATALMQPEPMEESVSDVRKMIAALEKRYGKE